MNLLFVADSMAKLERLRRTAEALPLPFPARVAVAMTAPEVITHLEGGAIDVLVTDHGLPRATHEYLLEVVRRRWPHVVRLVVTDGYIEEGAAAALPTVPDLLVTSCEPDDLLASLAAVSDSIAQRAAHHLVLVRDLPVRPELLTRCREAVDAGADSRRIASIVETDIAASAKVLHLANSAYFGLPSTATPAEAVTRLGTEAVIAVITRLCAERLYVGVDPAIHERMNQRSLEVARAVRRRLGDDPLAFTCALLHDIGVLVLLGQDAGADRVLLATSADGVDVRADEHARFGVAHDRLGAQLLDLWQFNPAVVEVVAHHHNPDDLLGWPLEVARAIADAEPGSMQATA